MSKVYEYVTEEIIKRLEEGTIPWRQPWIGHQVNYVSRKAYTGINTILLKKVGEYLTFNQIKNIKGNLKKGSKSEFVVFFKPLDIKEEDENEKKYKPFVLRYYKVFHISDTDLKPKTMKKFENKPIENAENIIKGYKDIPVLKNNATDKAYYSPSHDYVNVPPLERFEKPEWYYSTVFHELAHSTGHKSRLDRFDNNQPSFFGSEDYSKEELIAEFTSSMLCAKSGIEQKTLDNSASYIASWLSVLKNDSKILINSASQAQKASDYILGKEKNS
jgi:antirestriction protein ArdC